MWNPSCFPRLPSGQRRSGLFPRIISDILSTRPDCDLAGGLHGAEHAIIALMPLHVMCDRWDIGGLSSPMFGENGEPVIFVYDAYEGGIGLAEKAYEVLPALLASAHELVRDCTCEKGCPSCIYSPKCGNDNQPLDKEATILILGELCHESATPESVMDPARSETVLS